MCGQPYRSRGVTDRISAIANEVVLPARASAVACVIADDDPQSPHLARSSIEEMNHGRRRNRRTRRATHLIGHTCPMGGFRLRPSMAHSEARRHRRHTRSRHLLPARLGSGGTGHRSNAARTHLPAAPAQGQRRADISVTDPEQNPRFQPAHIGNVCRRRHANSPRKCWVFQRCLRDSDEARPTRRYGWSAASPSPFDALTPHSTRRRVGTRYARMVSTSQVRDGTRFGEHAALLKSCASSTRLRIVEHAVGADSKPSSPPDKPRQGSDPSVLLHAGTGRCGTRRSDKPRAKTVCAPIRDTASPIDAALPSGLNRA